MRRATWLPPHSYLLSNGARTSASRQAELTEGYSQQQVAAFLGVNVRTVRKWWQLYRKRGDDGLNAKPHSGRHRKLNRRQEGLILNWIRKNPKSFGFATELWTAPRLAQVIQRKFGIQFHPRYLNQWLAERHVTPQKPQRKARERNDEEIEQWKEHDWMDRPAALHHRADLLPLPLPRLPGVALEGADQGVGQPVDLRLVVPPEVGEDAPLPDCLLEDQFEVRAVAHADPQPLADVLDVLRRRLLADVALDVEPDEAADGNFNSNRCSSRYDPVKA
jgi:transposase